MQSTILGSSTIGIARDQVVSDLVDEVVILNLKSGAYYGLNEVGSRVWDLVQEPKSVNHIQDIILEEYEVEPDRLEQDLLTLLQELEVEGLIDVER